MCGIYIWIYTWNIYLTWNLWKICRDDWRKELMVFKMLHILKDRKISICFRLREGCWALTSSNAGKYSTVKVRYIRRVYLFYLWAVFTRRHRLKLFVNFFHWIVGGGHLLWELHLLGIPYQMMLGWIIWGEKEGNLREGEENIPQ